MKSTKLGRIFVTGAEGFIGSHLVEKLVTTGYDVNAFVLYNSFNYWGWLENLDKRISENVKIHTGDIRDISTVRLAMQNCDAVIHLAALIAIPHSYLAPRSYLDTNVLGTLNVLETAKELNIRRFIHTSTSEVYGSAKYVPIPETHPLNAQSPYAASKIAADQLANSYYSSFGLPVVTARPFNTYGPRQSARAVIPTIISQVLANNGQISLGNTHATRDFTHVFDTVSAYVAMLESNEGTGEVFNFGSNFEISIQDLALLIGSILDIPVKIKSEDKRFRPINSEVNQLWADNSRFQSAFSWEKQFSGLSGLEKGLEHTITWFNNPENMKFYKSDIYNL